jgi:hypothetical protein
MLMKHNVPMDAIPKTENFKKARFFDGLLGANP